MKHSPEIEVLQVELKKANEEAELNYRKYRSLHDEAGAKIAALETQLVVSQTLVNTAKELLGYCVGCKEPSFKKCAEDCPTNDCVELR